MAFQDNTSAFFVAPWMLDPFLLIAQLHFRLPFSLPLATSCDNAERLVEAGYFSFGKNMCIHFF